MRPRDMSAPAVPAARGCNVGLGGNEADREPASAAAMNAASLQGEQRRAEAEQQAADRDQIAADYEANCGTHSPRQVAAYGVTRALRRRTAKARGVAGASRAVAASFRARVTAVPHGRQQPFAYPTGRPVPDGLRSHPDAALALSRDAILAKDLRGNVTAWNPAAELLYGFTAQQILGRPVSVLFPPDAAGEADYLLAEVQAGRTVPPFDTERMTRGGERIPVSVTVAPILDAAGAVVGASSIAFDISDRLYAQAERAWTTRLVFQAGEAVIAVDHTGRITLWNPAAQELFGHLQSDAVGRRFQDLVVAREPAGRAQIARSLACASATPRIEAALRHQSGRPLVAEISVGPLNASNGRLAGAVVCIRDLTAAQESAQRIDDGAARESSLVRELEQTRRFESAGQLTSAIGHDFNQYLGVILNLADLIAAESPARSVVQLDALEISATAKRAGTLVRQLLTFTRPGVAEETGAKPGAVVREFEQFLGRAAGPAVALRITEQAGGWPVELTRGQLEQIVVNLVVNARDAMPGGGTVTVHTGNTTAGEPAQHGVRRGRSDARFVTVTVTDTGTGMAPEVLKRALEPFYSTKANDEGTGLGLATVARIANEAGGAVTIESEPGQGTAVHVRLPAAGSLVPPQVSS